MKDAINPLKSPGFSLEQRHAPGRGCAAAYFAVGRTVVREMSRGAFLLHRIVLTNREAAHRTFRQRYLGPPTYLSILIMGVVGPHYWLQYGSVSRF